MKKVLSLFIALIIIFSLAACGKDDESTKITLELNGGIGDASISEDIGSAITEPTPTKEGFTFGGWYIDAEFTYKYVFNTMPKDNLKLYAEWVGIPFTLTFELYGGTGESSIIKGYGAALTAPVPTQEGYTFDGWYADSAFTMEYVFETMPLRSFTIYAKWIIDTYAVTVSTSTVGATPTIVVGEIVNDKQTYSITTDEVEGFVFSYWQVLDTTDIVSLEQSFIYTPSADVALEAVYREGSGDVEPTLFFETGFEDGAKQSYASAELTLSGESWWFEDALVGSLATDLSISGNSVRIRNGYIQTQFSVEGLAQIVFHAGTYGSDGDSTVTFEISADGITWVIVDSFLTTNSLEEHNYIFDEAMFSSLSLSSSDSYYLKIVSASEGRTNVDDFQIYTGEGQLVDNTPLYAITFTDDMVYSYLLDDLVDLSECVATHPTTGVTSCDVIGDVDSSISGIYEVTFFKIDEFGNTATETVSITIIGENNTEYLTWDLDVYYDDAEGLYGAILVDALNTIINNGFNGVTYGEARYILDDSDQDPDNASNLILVYFGTSINSGWDAGSTWNREHVWPQSLLGSSADNGTVNVASDLYNLMPANPGENSSRGNSPYSEMGLGYEPRDEVKGDVARALFYMMVMYPELNLVDTAPGIHEMGYLSELLQWHIDDPVDAFELNRLEVIASEQDNRNPFVDYPHFVELIWFQE